jgi:transposase
VFGNFLVGWNAREVVVRGKPERQVAMLTSLSTEDLIPAAMYSIRSERAFCERLNYDLLFNWFLDLRIDQPSFDATTFTKNRQRLLDHEVADEFFAAVVRQAKFRRYISSDHFSVDGTLLNAWASHKSFKPKEGPTHAAARRAQRRGAMAQREALERHPRLHDRPRGQAVSQEQQHAATLCYAGHLLIEHRSALIVDAELTTADCYAERATALDRLARLPKSARRRTVAGDKNYDSKAFIADTRALGFTPHVAPNVSGNRRLAIDGGTARHAASTSRCAMWMGSVTSASSSRRSSEKVRLSVTPSDTASSTSPSSAGTAHRCGEARRSPRARSITWRRSK